MAYISVAVDALAPLLQHLLLDVGNRAAALPLGASLARQERLSVPGLAVAIVVLGKGLPVRPVVGVEVLEEAELVMALGLDQFVLPDQEPVLLDVVPLQRAVVAVVTHLRLQTGLTPSANSVNELPNIYRNDEEPAVHSLLRPSLREGGAFAYRSTFFSGSSPSWSMSTSNMAAHWGQKYSRSRKGLSPGAR